MQNSVFLPYATAILLSSVGLVPNAVAQPERAIQQQRAAERAQAEREREAAETRRESLAEDLERAREQMAEAAREVARLSAEFAAPFIGDMSKQWRFAGQRALLGLNPEDTELGVRVAGVSPNGAAAAAGLTVGDVIVEIEGAALADPRVTERGDQSPSELLLAQMENVEPGARVALKVSRDAQERDVVVQTRERNSGFGFDYDFGFDGAQGPSPRVWTGMFFNSNPWRAMQLVTLTPQLGSYFGAEKGILVVRGPGSDALVLQDGDVILDIGGREPATPEHAVRILASFEE
ncbi:MAG TPA: PDZ domain-containing protein, partial [Gammaproteobacteria bacterium]|nr:PDZ domain-containing protein [Gammaproteobacteria bacterium]